MDVALFDYWRSSASYRVRIGLNLLGLQYTKIAVDLLAGDQRSPENLTRNPQGLVPTLDIDGTWLTQSLAMLEYLNETRSAGWLPADPIGRARTRALAYAVAMDTHPICNPRVAKHAVSLGAKMEGWMQHFIGLGLEGVERMLDDSAHDHCFGHSVTLADICLVPQVYNARRWKVDLEPFPKVARIAEALECLTAFREAHPDRDRSTG